MEFPQFLYILIFSNILALTTEFVSEYNSVISTAGESWLSYLLPLLSLRNPRIKLKGSHTKSFQVIFLLAVIWLLK